MVDLRTALRSAAGAPRRAADIDRALLRGRLLRKRRRMQLIVAASTLLTAVGAGALLFVNGSLSKPLLPAVAPAQTTIQTEEPPGGTQESGSGREARCHSAPAVPTYLPWLAAGERVPPPEDRYDSDIDMASRIWIDPDAPDVAIALTRRPEQLQSGPGERTGITMQGAEGELSFHHGKSVAIAWDLVNERCNFVVLSFYYGERAADAAKREVIKVARSLEHKE